MTALAVEDLAKASALAEVSLTDYFLTEQALWLWRYRLAQIAGDPEHARWMARYAVVVDQQVVGHAGFHGPPDDTGMVEIAYSVAPAWRRRGYARAMLVELLRRASDEGVSTVRATISPDNAGSLATIAGFGFVHVGEQIDPVDGLELIFEVKRS